MARAAARRLAHASMPPQPVCAGRHINQRRLFTGLKQAVRQPVEARGKVSLAEVSRASITRNRAGTSPDALLAAFQPMGHAAHGAQTGQGQRVRPAPGHSRSPIGRESAEATTGALEVHNLDLSGKYRFVRLQY